MSSGHLPGDELLSRSARRAYDELCEEVTPCLSMCRGELVNVCAVDLDEDVDDIDSNGIHNDRVMVMGHAGGDPVSVCENTAESTVNGLKKGIIVVGGLWGLL